MNCYCLFILCKFDHCECILGQGVQSGVISTLDQYSVGNPQGTIQQNIYSDPFICTRLVNRRIPCTPLWHFNSDEESWP